ncbi:TPA: hypothetical protein ACOPCQ_001945, partial [Streptococcus pneumoniae]
MKSTKEEIQTIKTLLKTLVQLNIINAFKSFYSKMKQEQDKSIRTVKSISNNVLEAEVYYSSLNPLYLGSDRKALHKP